MHLHQFTYVTGQPVWINTDHITSVRYNAPYPDAPEAALINTVDGGQFAVKGDAAALAGEIRAQEEFRL